MNKDWKYLLTAFSPLMIWLLTVMLLFINNIDFLVKKQTLNAGVFILIASMIWLFIVLNKYDTWRLSDNSD